MLLIVLQAVGGVQHSLAMCGGTDDGVWPPWFVRLGVMSGAEAGWVRWQREGRGRVVGR